MIPIDSTKIAWSIGRIKGSKDIVPGLTMTLGRKSATKGAGLETTTTIMTQGLMKEAPIDQARLEFQDVLPANTVDLQVQTT